MSTGLEISASDVGPKHRRLLSLLDEWAAMPPEALLDRIIEKSWVWFYVRRPFGSWIVMSFVGVIVVCSARG